MTHEEELRGRIPSHLMGAIDRYINLGISPGGFLSAVIQNDLFGAFNRADNLSKEHIEDIVTYIYNYLPHSCWGSRQAQLDWMTEKQHPVSNVQ